MEEKWMSDARILALLRSEDDTELQALMTDARAVCDRTYGRRVFFRGLIEFTNHCKNNCYYCGIRRQNANIRRYRLTDEEIFSCCRTGYALGYRTFVLQGGEDPAFTADRICSLVSGIKKNHPDCALTLSIGEWPRADYVRFFEAGADRYLLRHETADPRHYARLHPPEMSGDNRKRCLWDLKDIGFQTGAGLMVGSPFQTEEELLADLHFLKELQPQMVGIGPFIPQADTPFGSYSGGSRTQTLKMVALCRLLLPKALLPATTALGTIASDGREQALRAGANVVMPNLSPTAVRSSYAIYDNKLSTGDEAAESRIQMENRILAAGFEPDLSRGDFSR